MSMPHLSWDDFIILWAFIMHREAKQRGWAFGLIAIIRIQKSDCQVLSLSIAYLLVAYALKSSGF